MAEAGAFWSYVHTDDEVDGGRIAQLARDVVAEYQMLTGDSIYFFLDRDNIDWGDEWKLKIDSTLESVAFFIAVLTPRYFRSVECRRELNFFARRAGKIGISDLILPILYVDFPAFREDVSQDDAIKLAKSFQWKDWTGLRFEAADSPKYRRAVNELARRLAAASALTETVETTEAKIEAIQDDEDIALGFIDRLARMEDAMPKLTNTMGGVAAEILNIGEIMTRAAAKMKSGDEEGKGFAGRLLVFNEIAQELDEPVMQIFELSNSFTTQLNDVDLGVKAIAEQIPREIQENPESESSVESFITSLRQLAEQAEVGLGQMEEMAKIIEPVERGSRSARPVLRKLRKAVTVLAEGRSVTREWDRLFGELDTTR